MNTLKRMLYHGGRTLGLFRATGRATRHKLRILCYHGFASADEYMFRPGVFMRAGTFRRRLEFLRRSGVPVLPLDEAIDRLADDRLPPRATVLTLDDGFANVARIAAPMLAEFRFPATVYVSSYYCGHAEHPVFRLAVQYMFYKSRGPLSPDGLDVPGLERLDSTTERAGQLESIMRHGEEELDEPGRDRLAARVAERFEIDYEEIRTSRILGLMRPDELTGLVDSGIDVQLHTHRHRFPETPEEAAREIEDNRRALEPRVAGPLVHFCYPSGVWSERHWPLLEQAGIRTATTCDVGLNDHRTPLLALRRFLDGEQISQIEFEAEICGMAELARRIRGKRHLVRRQT